MNQQAKQNNEEKVCLYFKTKYCDFQIRDSGDIYHFQAYCKQPKHDECEYIAQARIEHYREIKK